MIFVIEMNSVLNFICLNVQNNLGYKTKIEKKIVNWQTTFKLLKHVFCFNNCQPSNDRQFSRKASKRIIVKRQMSKYGSP